MRVAIIVATAFILAGCNGPYNLGPDALSSSDGVGMEPMRRQTISLNQPPGRFADFADYSLAVDPDLMRDAEAMGGNRTHAHCVAEKIGRRVHGSDYDLLSAAVSGRAQLSAADERRVQAQQDLFMRSMMTKKAEGRQMLDAFWHECLTA
jgi:hypothetical protein